MHKTEKRAKKGVVYNPDGRGAAEVELTEDIMRTYA